MKTKITFYSIVSSLALLSFIFYSCERTKDQQQIADIIISSDDLIDSTFLTKELQSKLVPDTILEILKARNLEYIDDNLTVRNTSKRIREASLGQYPAAVILSCLDSRVPVEDVFHSGIGDLFVTRVAGNIINEDILGSMEYACKVSGAKLIVVLGHEHCGAINSAIKNVKMGNITALLSKIQPAVQNCDNYEGDKNVNNPKYVEAVTHANVLSAIDRIRKESPILKEMEEKDEIKIVGAEYHMSTGKVDFLQNN